MQMVEGAEQGGLLYEITKEQWATGKGIRPIGVEDAAVTVPSGGRHMDGGAVVEPAAGARPRCMIVLPRLGIADWDEIA